MERLKASILFSFRAKLVLPAIIVIVLLMSISMWIVNGRITRQLQADAAQMLLTAEAVLKNSREIRANNLLLRYRNVVIEPRFKAAAGVSDEKTFRYLLNEMIEEGAADAIVRTADSGRQLTTVTHDPWIDADHFEAGCADILSHAMQGQPVVETLRNNGRLYDIVALPVVVGKEITGAVAFGVRNSIAQEFNKLTQSDLVLLSDRAVLATTLVKPELQAKLMAELSTRDNGMADRLFPLVVEEEHLLVRTGSLTPPGRVPELHYVIVSSYEKPLQALRDTQEMLLLISAAAMLVGGTFIWLIVRRVAQPLRELCESAEAIGQGDFTRRVNVRSKDECGELAHAFNRMTEKLKASREQLESTVDRLKTTQAQLVQSEKLSGIGEFVAGVAHELNNPLTSVMGFSDLLKRTDVEPQHLKYVDMILKSARRCQKIVQSLLGFARRHQPERKPTCLNQVVEASLDILRYQLRTNNIEVELQLDPGLPEAMVDSHQIQQVIVNLINNARQAIEAHQPSGRIWISTEAVGTSVVISIRDSGPGISKENLSKLFDPFFTTKPVGQGTGLGLSLCYGIIKEHGGEITARSNAGEGATFVIQLPVSKHPSPDAAPAQPAVCEPAIEQEGAGRRVLVIDDEESIGMMIREILSLHGYEVDVVLDGESGLNRLRQSDYDVTLCDWKMPGLNGREVYKRLQSIKPAQARRVVFITGDLVNEDTRKFIESQKRLCIAKPFDLAEFRGAVSRAMAN